MAKKQNNKTESKNELTSSEQQKQIDLLQEELEKDKKRLTSAQYWEWRCSIEELKSSDLNFKRVMLERELKELNIELRKKELILFKEVIINASNEKEKIKKDYEVYKQNLEKEIGCSLSNKIIDDITYEIKDVDKN